MVMVFNIVIVAIAFRVLIKQNRKKFFQGGSKHLVRMNYRNFISLMWLIVLFGLGWVFGLLTIRDVSPVFRYLFVILNGFQGFYFFIFICLNQKEARDFWALILTIGHFKITKNVMSHHKMYANSSDYKVRGNCGISNLSSLPDKANEKKKAQLVDYLTLPNKSQIYASDSFMSTNESFNEPNSLELETVHEATPGYAAVDDSHIEITTYFNPEEMGSHSLSNIEVGQHNDEHDHSTPTAQHSGDSSCDIVTGDVIYVNPKISDQQDVEEEEVPIPPQRRKRKMKNRCAATEKDCSKVERNADDDYEGASPLPPRRHKYKTVASASRNVNEAISATDEGNIDNNNRGHAQRQSRTARHEYKTPFGEVRISLQGKMLDPFETSFEVINPLYGKEE